MPDTYTATDPKSGRTITFEWNAAQPPTDADMEEVFAAAGSQKHPYARVAEALMSPEFRSNALSSGANAIKGLATAGAEAVDAGVFGGMGSQLLGRKNTLVEAVKHPVDTASAIGSGLKDRYGSAEAMRNTLYTDPVGAAVDAYGLIGGGANLAGRVATKAGQLGQSSGVGLMRSALKVPEKVVATSPYLPDDLRLADTALKEGINRSTGGRQKLDRIITPTAQQKGALLEQSSQRFNPHDPTNFPKWQQQLDQTKFESSIDPAAPGITQGVLSDFQAAEKYNRPFTPIEQVSARTIHASPTQMTPETASPVQNAFLDKVRLGEGMSKNAWTKNPADMKPQAAVDAQKALYGDLKAIEEQVPGVAQLNATLEPQYALREYLVNTIGAPGVQMPYPSGGGVARAVGGAILPYAESVGARGVWNLGRVLERAGRAATTATPGAPALGGLDAIQRAILGLNRDTHQR